MAARTRGRRRRTLPTWRERVGTPELAILGALESAIDIAIVSLVAAQPELHPSPDGRDPDSSPAAAAADDIIGRAQALVAAIDHYRVALQRQADDDLLF